MEFRTLGKTGIKVSAISLGTWQVGGKWGASFSDANADEILNKAIDSGINFIDTADVYDDGESEKSGWQVIAQPKRKNFCGYKMWPPNTTAY
ncbi:MAG: aldo/keto reductase [Ferruginibacter sp.]